MNSFVWTAPVVKEWFSNIRTTWVVIIFPVLYILLSKNKINQSCSSSSNSSNGGIGGGGGWQQEGCWGRKKENKYYSDGVLPYITMYVNITDVSFSIKFKESASLVQKVQ